MIQLEYQLHFTHIMHLFRTPTPHQSNLMESPQVFVCTLPILSPFVLSYIKHKVIKDYMFFALSVI